MKDSYKTALLELYIMEHQHYHFAKLVNDKLYKQKRYVINKQDIIKLLFKLLCNDYSNDFSG